MFFSLRLGRRRCHGCISFCCFLLGWPDDWLCQGGQVLYFLNLDWQLCGKSRCRFPIRALVRLIQVVCPAFRHLVFFQIFLFSFLCICGSLFFCILLTHCRLCQCRLGRFFFCILLRWIRFCQCRLWFGSFFFCIFSLQVLPAQLRFLLLLPACLAAMMTPLGRSLLILQTSSSLQCQPASASGLAFARERSWLCSREAVLLLRVFVCRWYLLFRPRTAKAWPKQNQARAIMATKIFSRFQKVQGFK